MSCFLAGPQATNSFFMAADPFHWPNIIKASILKIHVMFGKRLPGRARRKLARLARRKPELREERGMGGTDCGGAEMSFQYPREGKPTRQLKFGETHPTKTSKLVMILQIASGLR